MATQSMKVASVVRMNEVADWLTVSKTATGMLSLKGGTVLYVRYCPKISFPNKWSNNKLISFYYFPGLSVFYTEFNRYNIEAPFFICLALKYGGVLYMLVLFRNFKVFPDVNRCGSMVCSQFQRVLFNLAHSKILSCPMPNHGLWNIWHEHSVLLY